MRQIEWNQPKLMRVMRQIIMWIVKYDEMRPESSQKAYVCFAMNNKRLAPKEDRISGSGENKELQFEENAKKQYHFPGKKE